MKQDMDLIRKILTEVEKTEAGRLPDYSIEGYTDEQIGYHAALAVEAGLAVGDNLTGSKNPMPARRITSLTHTGHEFLKAARDDRWWRKLLALAKDKTGDVSLKVLVSAATDYVKGKLNL